MDFLCQLYITNRNVNKYNIHVLSTCIQFEIHKINISAHNMSFLGNVKLKKSKWLTEAYVNLVFSK